MDDNTPTVVAPVVERNGVNMTLVEQTFGKKAKLAGQKFFAPETSSARFNDDVTWIGVDWLVSVANKRMRLDFADIYVDNIDKTTGLLNQEQWALDAADFTSGIAKLSDLEADLDELIGLQQGYALDANFGEDSDAGKALDVSIKDVASKIKPIRANIAAIKAKYGARAEARKVKEAASTTATPEAPAVS